MIRPDGAEFFKNACNMFYNNTKSKKEFIKKTLVPM